MATCTKVLSSVSKKKCEGMTHEQHKFLFPVMRGSKAALIALHCRNLFDRAHKELSRSQSVAPA